MKKMPLVAVALLSVALLAGCQKNAVAESSGVSSSAAPVSSSESVSSSSVPVAPTVTGKKVPLYLFMPALKNELNVVFLNGDETLPYLEVSEGVGAMRLLFAILQDANFALTMTDDNGVITLTRENHATVVLDFQKKTITFSDFCQFLSRSYVRSLLDCCSLTGYDAATGKATYIKRYNDTAFVRNGGPFVLNLGAYDLPMLYQDGKGYLPLQTFSDIFFCPCNASLIYNGLATFVVSNQLGLLKDLYYEGTTPKARSQELANFAYKEMIFFLDHTYGLREIHGINSSFDAFLDNNGLKADLLSTDPVVADKAMVKLTDYYFADYHSGFGNASFYAGKDANLHVDGVPGSAYHETVEKMQQYTTARTAALGAEVPSYQVVGTDTAFITFDEFKGLSQDYYTTAPTLTAPDTFGVIAYAHGQIAANAAIKNVVLDLSCNGGGAADAAAYVVGAFLANGNLALTNVYTGDALAIHYASDTNLDHQFDASDTFADKNVYCLISPYSFSCGNLVPTVFKDSGKVTLIGQRTGGGSQIVQPAALADGSVYQCSGASQISSYRNGGFYSAEGGVMPDYALSQPADYYDRVSLVTFIDSLK
jgi:hypothetical protein